MTRARARAAGGDIEGHGAAPEAAPRSETQAGLSGRDSPSAGSISDPPSGCFDMSDHGASPGQAPAAETRVRLPGDSPSSGSIGDPPSDSADRESFGSIGDPPSSDLGYPPSLDIGDPPSSDIGDPPSSDIGDPPSSDIGDPPSSDQSDDGRMRGRRVRGRKKRRTKAATVGGDDARKQFVDLAGCGIIAERCQAIQRYLGSVRQCRGQPADGSRLCGYHADHERWALAKGEGLKYGRLDAEVFDAAILGRWVKGDVQAGLRKLESAGHAPRRKAPQRKHWYTRHHMWQCALQVRELPENVGRGRLDYLEDLATEEMRAALTKVSSTFKGTSISDAVLMAMSLWNRAWGRSLSRSVWIQFKRATMAAMVTIYGRGTHAESSSSSWLHGAWTYPAVRSDSASMRYGRLRRSCRRTSVPA